MFLTAFYVGIIQIVLFLMTFVILFCELTKVFADTVKSVILRTVVAFSLLTLGFYAHYLEYLPYHVVVSLFVITLATCFWTSKFIFKEYTKRKRKQDRLERITEIREIKMLLKVGSTGNKVKELQKLLSLTTDGIFGINTLKAVKDFQSKNGLISDGVVGSKTWDVLLNTPKIDAQDKQKHSLSNNGMKLLEQFEGLRLESYLDSARIATIGWGSIRYPNGNKVKLGDKITKAQAKQYKLYDLKEFESTVNTSVKVPLTQNQYDALVSLSYNIGSGAFKNSTLLKKLNSGDYKGAAEQFLVWNKVNSKKVQGLVNRREAERNLFIK